MQRHMWLTKFNQWLDDHKLSLNHQANLFHRIFGQLLQPTSVQFLDHNRISIENFEILEVKENIWA